MRLLLIALLPFALAGCWTGTRLYSASDARPVIPPGAYKAVSPDADSETFQVSILPNGMTQFGDGEDKDEYGFAPLDPAKGMFVAWEIERDSSAHENATNENQTYALVVRQPNGTFLAYLPSCTDEEAEIARKNGAVVESGIAPTCAFVTRAGLEQALRALPQDEKSAMKLERVP
jgi:hypothetical protein